MSTMVEQAKEKLVEASRALEAATRAEEAKKREIAEANELLNVLHREASALFDARVNAASHVTATALTFATAEREEKTRPRPFVERGGIDTGWRDVRDGQAVIVVEVRSGGRRWVRVVEPGSSGSHEAGDEYEINLDDTDIESSDPTDPYWRRSPAHDMAF